MNAKDFVFCPDPTPRSNTMNAERTFTLLGLASAGSYAGSVQESYRSCGVELHGRGWRPGFNTPFRWSSDDAWLGEKLFTALAPCSNGRISKFHAPLLQNDL